MRNHFKVLALGMAIGLLLACTATEQAAQTTPPYAETISMIVTTTIAMTTSARETPIEVLAPTETASYVPSTLPTFTTSPLPAPIWTATPVPTITPLPILLGQIRQLYLPTPTPPPPGGTSYQEFTIAHAQMATIQVIRQLCNLALSYSDPTQVTFNASDEIWIFWLEIGSPATLGGNKLVTVEIYREGTPQALAKEDFPAMGNYLCSAVPLSSVSPGKYATKFTYGNTVKARDWSVQ